MRRALPLLLALATGAAGLAVAAPSPAAASGPSAAASDRAHEAVPDQLLVGYVAGASESAKERARGRAGAAREEVVVEAAADRTAVELVRLPAGRDRARAIADLQADPAVRYAEPNWVYRASGKPTTTTTSASTTTAFPNPLEEPDFKGNRLWGLSATSTVNTSVFGSQASAVWPTTSAAAATSTVYVGVIDEGIQHTHPDLNGQVGNPGESGALAADGRDNDGNGKVDDAYGWDFAGRNNTVYDGGTRGSVDDHGTHVAGTIAAKADGKAVVGVAPYGVKMISGKFLGANGGTTANAIAAVDYFNDLKTKRNVNIVATNNSWGGGGYSAALHDAIKRGVNAGILFIAAAGNGGSDGVGDNNDSSTHYPSDYDTGTVTAGSNGAVATAIDHDGKTETPPVPFNGVVGVSAIASDGGLAKFSNYGATEVHIGAPGVDVLSTTAFNGWTSYSGTSMATPHVSGGVAVLGAYKPLDGTPIEIAKKRRDAILGSAAPTASLSATNVTPRKVSTSGRLDVAAALAW